MSEISSVGGVHPLGGFTRPASSSPTQREATGLEAIEDAVEFSRFSVTLQEVVEQSSWSLAKTRAIRAEIAAGTYETPDRIRGTVERLLDVIG